MDAATGQRLRAIGTSLLSVMLLVGVGPFAVARAGTTTTTGAGTPTTLVARLAGPDRYATSAAISASAFAPGVPVVYVDNGTDWPDALTAGPVAARAGGPIVLVGKDTVPAVVAAELARLKPAKIVVLGGVGVTSVALLTALAKYAPLISRLAGPDHDSTAAAISASAFAPGVPVAYIDNDTDWPDGLSAGPVAARAGGPILYTTATTIPVVTAAELTRLRPATIIALGSSGVTSDALLAALRHYAPAVSRIGGADRYATSALLSASSFGPGAPVAYLDGGTDWPDALAAVPVATKAGGPILLVGATRVPPVTRAEVARLAPAKLIALGGESVLSEACLYIAAGRPAPVTSYHVPILLYHVIAPISEAGDDLPHLVVDPALFDAQLALLKANGWHTITSVQFSADLYAKVAIPAKTFMITIDDGHDDGYIHAFPVLQKYGFTATYFVITDRVRSLDQGYLTPNSIQTMGAAGEEIANHTVSHVDFSTYTLAQDEAQVNGAQTAIASWAGATPVSFAYPFGAAYPNLETAVKAAGLKVAYLEGPGTPETLATAYALPRTEILNTTTAAQVMKMVTTYH